MRENRRVEAPTISLNVFMRLEGAAISNIHFNNNTNMLAAFRERRVVVWTSPSVVFTDRNLLALTIVELETENLGKSSFIVG